MEGYCLPLFPVRAGGAGDPSQPRREISIANELNIPPMLLHPLVDIIGRAEYIFLLSYQKFLKCCTGGTVKKKKKRKKKTFSFINMQK